MALRKPINPFHFYLAKRLAQYRYYGTQNPNDLQFVKKIYDTYKSKKFEHTTYVDNSTQKVKNGDLITIEQVSLDPQAKGIAKRIHKILKSKDLRFTDYMLDYLVREIKELNFPTTGGKEIPFRTWKEFVDYFKNERGAFEADKMCQHKSYLELSASEKKMIQDAVEYKFTKLCSRSQKLGHDGNIIPGIDNPGMKAEHVIATCDSYTIRMGNRDDIDVAVSLTDDSNKYNRDQRIDKLERWWDINPHILFLYIDELGIGGYISLIPVTQQWFEELLKNERFTKPILKSDIIAPSETHQTKNILIESIEAATPRAMALLKFYIPLIVEKLVEGIRHDFSVLYIAEEENDQHKIKNLGFADFTTLMGESRREIRTLYIAGGRALLSMVNGLSQ